MYETTRPSEAVRPIFFAADANPFSRRSVVARSRSPSASANAVLHSINPTPVFSRNSLTNVAGIVADIPRPLFLLVRYSSSSCLRSLERPPRTLQAARHLHPLLRGTARRVLLPPIARRPISRPPSAGRPC